MVITSMLTCDVVNEIQAAGGMPVLSDAKLALNIMIMMIIIIIITILDGQGRARLETARRHKSE